jgi:glycosyltransferase involved in cell wall biosynthesis
MTQPSVSIFIPTYNRRDLLRLSVLSAVAQRYSKLNVHVIDNCSTDGTYEIIQDLKKEYSNLYYTRNPSNLGALANFQRCFKQAADDYFSILSDDDILLPGFVEELVKAIEVNRCDFAIGNSIYLDETYCLAAPYAAGQWAKFVDAPKILPPGVPITWTAMLFSRKMAKLYTDADMRFEIGNDIRFLMLAMASYSYVRVPSPCAFYVNHKGSLSSMRSDAREGRSYYVVQLHRYAEILASPRVSDCEKKYVKKALKKAFRYSFKYNWLKSSLLLIFKAWENPESSDLKSRVELEFNSLSEEDERLMAGILRRIYRSRLVSLVYLLLVKFFLQPRRKKKCDMLKQMQNTLLAREFNYLRNLLSS